MSNLVKWAEEELNRIGNKDDLIQQSINNDILEIVKVFSEQGHSGFSASYALNIIKRLLSWKPIQPLTGEDDEWEIIHSWGAINSCDNIQQNKRCSEVFRKNFDNATAYYTNGKVFSDDGGRTWYTNRDSSIPITFPYIVPDEPERIILK